MVNTYNDYLGMPQSITVEEMQRIHEMMLDEVGNDEDALELYNDMLEKATSYAGIRQEWTFMSREQKMEEDPGRTTRHDALLIKLNVLARGLKSQGKAAAWRDLLGDEKADPYNRKRIGDFACYLAFVNGINER